MTLSDEVEGPRNASRPRQGAVFVSIYTWTCVVLGVALARLVISGLHKVNFGRDDLTAFAGSVGQTHLPHASADGQLPDFVYGLGRNMALHRPCRYGKTRRRAQLRPS